MDTLDNQSPWHKRHQTILQVILLRTVFLVAAVAFLRPGGYLLASAPDQFFYVEIGNMATQGLLPFVNYWMEYPPVFPWLLVASQYLIASVANPDATLFWFNNAMRWLMVPFEAGTVWLIYAIILKLGRSERSALEGAVFYAMLFTPLFVFLGWFDNLVLFFLILGIYGMVTQRPVLAGIAAGIGFGVKLFPVIILPTAFQQFRRNTFDLVKLAGATATSMAALFIPFLIIAPQYTLAFFRTLQSRSSWETVWALLEGQHTYGIVAPLGQRTDPMTALATTEPSSLPWWLITLVFAALGLYLWTRRIEWQAPIAQVSFTAITFGIFLLYSRGYSPQWSIFMTAFALILLPGWRGLLYALGISILTVLEWPVAFVLLSGDPAFLGTIVVLRTLLTIALCVEFALELFPEEALLQRVALRAPSHANAVHQP